MLFLLSINRVIMDNKNKPTIIQDMSEGRCRKYANTFPWGGIKFDHVTV
jgi:hypothetical protein